jgi:hypothetical protein
LGTAIPNFAPIAAINCYSDTFAIDATNSTMHFFEKSGVKLIGSKGSGNGQFLTPQGSRLLIVEIRVLLSLILGTTVFNFLIFMANFSLYLANLVLQMENSKILKELL